MKLLFVCTGNTCRSPMCEAYFNFLCGEQKNKNLFSESAGVSAGNGEPASRNAQSALAGYSTNITNHRSRALAKEMLDSADMIIALTESHRQAIGRISPGSAGKVSLLLDHSERAAGKNVPDPFGGDVREYAECFAEMKPALDNLHRKLTKIT